MISRYFFCSPGQSLEEVEINNDYTEPVYLLKVLGSGQFRSQHLQGARLLCLASSRVALVTFHVWWGRSHHSTGKVSPQPCVPTWWEETPFPQWGGQSSEHSQAEAGVVTGGALALLQHSISLLTGWDPNSLCPIAGKSRKFVEYFSFFFFVFNFF